VKATEEGQNAKISQTGGGKTTENRDDQVEDREAKEKAENKGNVVSNIKASDGTDLTVFTAPNGKKLAQHKSGAVFEFVEDEDDDEKEEDEKKEMTAKKGKKKFQEEDKKEDDEKKEDEKKEMSSKKKKLQDDEDDDEKKKKEDDEVELSEGVKIATKKTSLRESETLSAIRLSEGSTRKVLVDNLKMLRESRVESEQSAIKQMLDEHFLDGKLAPNEKDMWESLLCNEATQTDVAVYKLTEKKGEKEEEHYRPLSYIVNKMLSERPAIVELKELASKGGQQFSEEQQKMTEAKTIAARIAHRYNEDELKKQESRKLSEEKK